MGPACSAAVQPSEAPLLYAAPGGNGCLPGWFFPGGREGKVHIPPAPDFGWLVIKPRTEWLRCVRNASGLIIVVVWIILTPDKEALKYCIRLMLPVG